MSSNSQSQETADKTAGPPVQDRTKMIENFVKELVVDRDFKLNECGDIVMIRHLHVAKCTVPLLRQICVRFKVLGYKNQSKECTLRLLKNLVTRESLKNSIYDDSASCFSESSSHKGVPNPCLPATKKSGNKKSIAAENERSSIVLSPGQSSMSSTISDHDALENNESPEEEYHDAEQEELPFSDDKDDTEASLTSSSKKRKATGSTRTKDDDCDDTKKTKNGIGLSVRKRRQNTTKKKKRAKGTAPDAVTCINTYFCVINVYMCQRNRSLLMDLGRPPTKADLDRRTSPHRHVYEALLGQYLDEGNDDAAMFAFPDHVFWTLTGTRLDVAFSELTLD